MLRYRILSGLALGAAVVALAIWAPDWLVVATVAAVATAALWEFYRILDVSGVPHFKYLGIVLGLVLICCVPYGSNAVRVHGSDRYLMLLSGIVIVASLRLLPQKFNPRPISTAAGTLFGILYVPFFLSFLLRMVFAWQPPFGRCAAMYVIVVSKLADIGAFTVGCGIGRHKLVPRISPAKTWEGCFGGIIFGLLGSLFYSQVIIGRVSTVRLSLLHSTIIGILISIAGILGDLMESFFKRSAGVKDSGGWIRGMGGLLDVIDSILIASPVLYAYLQLFVFGGAL